MRAFTINRPRVTLSGLLLTAVALSGIENAIEVRIGPGWQLWLFPTGLAVLQAVSRAQAKPVTSRTGALIVWILVVVLSCSILGPVLVDYPDLSIVQRQQVHGHLFRISLTTIRLSAALLGIFLIVQESHRNREFPQRVVRAYLFGGAVVAVYGIYEFGMKLAGFTELLVPGTWGKANGILRAASFLYEPSQFGFFCAIGFLLSQLMVKKRVIQRRTGFLLGASYIGGLVSSISGSGMYALVLGIAAGMILSFGFLKRYLGLAVLLFPFAWLYVRLFFDMDVLRQTWRHKYLQAMRYDYWNSAGGRIEQRVGAWGEVLEINPVTGGGAGSTYFYKWGDFYTQWITDFGLFGVIVLAFLVVSIGRRLVREARRDPPLRGYYTATVVCFLIGIFNYDAIEHFWIWIVFYLLLLGMYAAIPQSMPGSHSGSLIGASIGK